MVRPAIKAVLLLSLVVGLVAVVLVSTSAGQARYQAANAGKDADVTLVAPGVAPLDSTRQGATTAQTQPSATQEPFTTEVLPPAVSEPVPTGRGLFDEITDRLLRALLNFF
ncbi:MAG: hypothetical protein M3328_17495 [Chloroflexota bacterium]|nr:hypothetical protein [Chloroflexota bacterium]